MRQQLDLSFEFFLLVKQLHKTPEDFSLKNALLRMVPQMMSLAKTNPLALYRLAHMYHPSSSQYKKMMQEAAARDCSDAMLSWSDLIINSPASSTKELQMAANYLIKITTLEDSYMEQQSRNLLKHPKIAKLKHYGKASIHILEYPIERRGIPQNERMYKAVKRM